MQGAGDIKMNDRYGPVPQGRSISWIVQRGGFEVLDAPLNRVSVPVASSRADPVRHRLDSLGAKKPMSTAVLQVTTSVRCKSRFVGFNLSQQRVLA